MKIIATRDSMCMGDDCDAPHKEILEFDPAQGISALLKLMADYLPKMSDIVWTVSCHENILGFIYSGKKGGYKTETACNDEFIKTFDRLEIFCRHYYSYMLMDKYPECDTLLKKVKQSVKNMKP